MDLMAIGQVNAPVLNLLHLLSESRKSNNIPMLGTMLSFKVGRISTNFGTKESYDAISVLEYQVTELINTLFFS
jgi:hypothetical protein